MSDMKKEIDILYSEAVAYAREDEGKIHAFDRIIPILPRIARLASNLPDAKINRYGRGVEQVTTCEAGGYHITVVSTPSYAHLVLKASSEKGSYRGRGDIFYNNPHARDYHNILRDVRR